MNLRTKKTPQNDLLCTCFRSFFSVPTQKIIQMPLPTRVGDTNWMCLSTNLIILARSCALTLHICNVQGTILIPEYHFFVCTFTLDVLILILNIRMNWLHHQINKHFKNRYSWKWKIKQKRQRVSRIFKHPWNKILPPPLPSKKSAKVTEKEEGRVAKGCCDKDVSHLETYMY